MGGGEPSAQVQVRRAGDRAVTRAGGIESRHSFSFGAHYDPSNVGHALLVAHNDDVVAAGSGYGTHPHQDLEIVTWVLDGALRHEDSRGHTGLVTPGLAQRLSAGGGVLHAERNDAGTGPSVRFVQMWVLPDEPGGEPDYAQQDVTGGLSGGDWITLASGLPRDRTRAAVPIRQRGAALHVVRLAAGQTAPVPDAPFVHLFVAAGTAELEGAGPLAEADAVRLTGAGAHALTGTGDGCEVLAWEMHGTGRALRWADG